MAVVREFALPDLGEGLTEAEIVRWLVAVGDVVAIDQPVVEVETAKAMVEVPCPYAGVVTARFGDEGAELPVGAALLMVAVSDPASVPGPDGLPTAGPGSGGASGAGGSGGGPDGGSGGGSGRAGGAREGAAGDEASGNVLVGYGTGAPAGRRRRLRAAPRGVGAWHTAGQVASPQVSEVGGGAVPQRVAVGAGRVDAAEVAAVGAAVVRAAPPRGRAAGRPGARPAGVEVAAGAGPGAADADVDADADAGVGGRTVPVISPLVRRLAREHLLDLRQLSGSGPAGLILRADVERAIAAAREAGAAVHAGTGVGAGASAAEGVAAVAAAGTVPAGGAGAPAASGSGVVATGVRESAPGTAVASAPGGDAARSATAMASGALARAAAGAGVREAARIPLRGVRGAVAEKLSRSRAEIPDATCWVDADATELLAARAAMNAAGGPKVSLLAVLARICTAALARFPELNARVDTEAREIVRLAGVALGFAAQTDRGLMVPVVHDAHLRDAVELSAEFARLTEQARIGRLTPAELTGGTFTLNNYGVFGVDGSTPIINHPEAAMLGVGRIVERPWVHGGELAVRRVVQLSLTFDHRVCDGGTAGGFLRYVADCVEQPAVLLRTV
ncbi:dihydrolipoamide acetyltransferase family protein [Streptomyces sp. HSW2009]|uniref:dihydrolipoamide acetyltransferase family protein n=1 Tax=Streptomyces sp. HSW2009 TaxID=3142890 RepID=UPI0032EF833F